MPPPGDDRDHEEILRLRERVHKLGSDIAAARMMVDDLMRWRTEHMAESDLVSRKVDEMTESDRIAQAVADKMRTQGPVIRWTRLQKCAAGSAAVVSFLAVIATAAKSLFF